MGTASWNCSIDMLTLCNQVMFDEISKHARYVETLLNGGPYFERFYCRCIKTKLKLSYALVLLPKYNIPHLTVQRRGRVTIKEYTNEVLVSFVTIIGLVVYGTAPRP